MFLSNIKLWNFRKFGSDTFDPMNPNLNLYFNKKLNVLIGENDSGKTAIIDAIKLVLKTHSNEWIKVEEDDFFQGQEHLKIELRFEELKDEEAKNFTEWLGWEVEGNDAKPYLKLSYEVNRKNERILPSEVKAGADDIGYPLNAEASEYLKVTYLKPLRDAENELIAKKNSRLSKILQNHEAFNDKKNHYLLKHFKNLNKIIEKYFEGKDENDNVCPDIKGKEIKVEIDRYIQDFYDKTKEINYKTTNADLKSILENLMLSIQDVQNPGLGTLNRLFMAAELLHLNKKNFDGLKLGLIEELEAHLHPQAQMKVIEALQKQTNIQLILTTHSPNLASKVKLENLIICKETNAFPMGENYTELEKENYIFLEHFLDVTKANLFFAKGIIFVEGWSEEILIPVIAKKLGLNLTEHEVSIINIGNIGFGNYSKIFLRKEVPEMNIPVAIVTDCDIREYELDASDSSSKRDSKDIAKEYIERKRNLENEYNINNNKIYIASKWTFEWCIFNSKFLSNKFIEIVKKTHSKTEWKDFESSLAKKLIKRTLNKTEIAYKLAQSIENEISIDFSKITNDDTIYYMIEAIKYACR